MKINTLDGLRGYAALFVLIAHLPFKEQILPQFMNSFLNSFQLGYFGVEKPQRQTSIERKLDGQEVDPKLPPSYQAQGGYF